MQTLDTFLDQDIPIFLDTFEQNMAKSKASEDEINRLLGHEYQRNVHKALYHGSFGEIPSKDYPMIKTTNIFTAMPKYLDPSLDKPVKENLNDEASVSEKEIEDLIPKEKKSDPAFDPKSLLRTLGSTRREDLIIYVKAIIALENKDKKEAVSLFYSLARKYLRNLAYRIRLQDALLLPGEAIPLPALPKPVKKSSPKKKVEEVKKSVIEDSKSPPKDPVDPYIGALEAIKKGDKDSAVNLLKELIRSKPNNLAFRLRLQEALEL